MKGNNILEKEVKIIEIDKDKVIRELESFGAKKIFDGEVDMIFIDAPNNLLKKGKKTLRIRKKENSLDGKTVVEVTLKIKVEKTEESESVNIREEYEFYADDFDKTLVLFENMGFKVRYRIKKHRTSYEWNNATFELDKYKNVPWIMEIEAENISNIRECAKRLGFSQERLLPWSLSDLLKHYSIEKTDKIE